jgi:hypothetical protein
VTDPYSGREQTKAKHFILKRYLQALAFKILTFSDVTTVSQGLGRPRLRISVILPS